MRLMAPIRRPLWMAAAVGEGVLEVALNVVREVRAALEEVVVAEPVRPTPYPPRRPVPTESEPGLFESTSTRSAPARPRTPPAPSVPVEAKTLADEPVLVAEFGETGAEDNAGAEVSVQEPWNGYDGMNVQAVKDRLAKADREALGAVVLYESFGKKRRSVTQAAERRLTQLTPPGS